MNLRPAAASRARFPLWLKLAAFAAVGVLLTHSVSLTLGAHVATQALAREQEALGRRIARLVAEQAADAVLVNDVVALQDLVAEVTADNGLGYCFIARGERVLASSFPSATPVALVALRSGGDVEPVEVVGKQRRYLDLAAPVLDGGPGVVRIGLDLSGLLATRRDMELQLSGLALAVIAAAVLAAFVVGRRVAQPVNELLAAADHFDPAAEDLRVIPRGHDEIAVLTERFNLMMARLRAAHQEQLEARRKALATERMAALGALVAGVAHEVNNPIAGMKTCLRRLETEELPVETREEYLELIGDGVRRVEQVMARLLDFARPRPISLEPAPLASLAREGTALVQPLLRERHVALRVVSDAPTGAHAWADRKQIGQALLNLLLNAAYVTAPGGEIRIRLRRRPGQWGIAVEDDGPGIPAAIRHRILDPFFSTKPEGEGTGLGLSVTQTIAEAHGGELAFDFPPRGAVGTLWLREAAGPPSTDGAQLARGG